MEPVTETHLQRMAQAIAAEVDPVCIILFGSRARGDARLDSDVDLLVVEDEPFGPARCRLDESERIYRAVTGMGIAKDILLFSADDRLLAGLIEPCGWACVAGRPGAL